MIRFHRPSVDAFQSRKVFHSYQRIQIESPGEWLHRIRSSISTCEYGIFNEIMLIDKFLSGLNCDDFAKLPQLDIWTEELIFHFINDNQCFDSTNYKDKNNGFTINTTKDTQIKEENSNENINLHFEAVDGTQMSYGSENENIGDDQLNEANPTLETNFKNTKTQFPAEQRSTTKKMRRPPKLKVLIRQHHHVTDKTFECYLCGCHSHRLAGLKIHFTKNHIQTKKIQVHKTDQITNSLKLDDDDGKSTDEQICDAYIKQKPLSNRKYTVKSVSSRSKMKIKGFVIDKSDNSVICLDCGKRFKWKNSYYIHRRIHTGINLFSCKLCGKQFTNSAKLKSHMNVHDLDSKTLECHLCSNKFERFRDLRGHFLRLHTVTVKRHLQCTMCSKTFSKQPDLDFHIKVHRGLVEGHKCQHCGKLFDKRWALSVHLTMHVKKKEFICETCGRAYKSANQLKKHSQIHNADRRFKCSECGQVLSNTSSLKNHMRQHTGERPHVCDLCGKNFIYKSVLIRHMGLHRNERPHACTICEKSFATSYHLKRHINTHTGNRSYACNQCDRTFMQNGTLKAHQLKIHPTIQPINLNSN